MPNEQNTKQNNFEFKSPTTQIFNVEGLFKTESTVPTKAALKMEQQIKIVNNRLYIYSNTDKVWYSVLLS